LAQLAISFLALADVLETVRNLEIPTWTLFLNVLNGAKRLNVLNDLNLANAKRFEQSASD